MKANFKQEHYVINVLDIDKEKGTAKARWIKPDGFVINMDDLPLSELEFLDEEIDWERRRFEIAKDVLCAVIPIGNWNTSGGNTKTRFAVSMADALIDELKKVI